MPEDKENPSGFKVVDRRSWTSEGDRRDTPEPVAPAAAPAPVQPPGRASAAPDLSDGARSLDMPGFETIISYLSTTALFQLGLLAGPGGEHIPPDLENAHRTIDMLEVLQEKTRGNLSKNESQLLEEVLYEMRMSFVEIQKRLAKSPQ